ncbi:MAG TPA: efflux RND transporter periplasmic adaptor subunit [Kofleriaceae bacterium]|nr:efflux RND transporter periplasmic adaptor subunit [Kofleriaceae bacterium]
MKRAAVALIYVLGCGGASDDPPSTDPMREPRVQQATRSETREDLDKPGFLGVLMPRGLAEVISPFTSTVSKLEVRLGDRVTRGQRLAQLDERPLREELLIANATLKASQASAAQADVERRAAASILEREKTAFEQGISSGAELSTAEFNKSKAEMNAARAAATVQEQRARIAQLTARLGDTSLVAPIDGRVALMYVHEGDRVEEGRGVIRVISSDELFVKFAIPSDKVGTVKPGDNVDISIGQLAITTTGVVRHVAPEIDPVAKMILADADLVSPPASLQSGIDCRIVPRTGP